jgi:hypothetical protein
MKKCEDIDKAVKSAVASGYRLIGNLVYYYTIYIMF